MACSTAKFISYDLRPAKQSERRILLDLLKIAGDCDLDIPSYRYVGMGANRFYDFLLIHKYLGIKRMISLEHNSVMFKRAVFNLPYKFIEVQEETAEEFIINDEFSQPSILWFDYDGGIKPHIVNDIGSLSSKLKVGDFCFVTVSGGLIKSLNKKNSQSRLEWFQEQFGDVAGEVSLTDVQDFSFPVAVHKVLIASFLNAFSIRRDGSFVPFLQVKYTDSVPMITVGGGFLADGYASGFKNRVSTALPFLSIENTKLYEIKSLHLTERERVLFDLATTAPDKRSSEHRKLKKLGFKDDEISAYKDLIRFLPRYVETII